MYFCWHELLNVSQKCLVLSIFNTTTPGHPHLALLLPQSFVPSLFIVHTRLLLLFVLLSDIVTIFLLKSLQWLLRLLDEDQCYQLGLLLSGQSSPHYQTSFIFVTPLFFPLKSLLTLLKWLLKWSSQDFNTLFHQPSPFTVFSSPRLCHQIPA